MKLPPTVEKYASEELNNIDFQSVKQGEDVPVAESTGDEFKPQADFDDSNKFFMQTKFAQQKLVTCPLASLSVSEIHD